MEVKPIETEADYDAALKEVEALMSAERDTPRGRANGLAGDAGRSV
jgi:antitoxin component HigA of HigAB toxin-antitoxin module